MLINIVRSQKSNKATYYTVWLLIQFCIFLRETTYKFIVTKVEPKRRYYPWYLDVN